MVDDLNHLPCAARLSRPARRIIRFSIALALDAGLFWRVGVVLGVVSSPVAVLVTTWEGPSQ